MGKNPIRRSKLLINVSEKWYAQKVLTEWTNGKRLSRDEEQSLRREAEELLEEETSAYKHSVEKGIRKSEFEWIWKVVRVGALADKLPAHSLLNQHSPVHNLSSLTTMLQLCQAKGKREYLLASEHMKELLLGDVLPPFKLKNFGDLVANVPPEPEKRSIHLMLSYYEDQLKRLYKDFIDTIERMSHDPVIATKNKSISILYELLCNNPEQEQLLLSHLANKLGDPCPKAASHALHLMTRVVTVDHPAMKEVVVKEVERLLFRANIKQQTQYRCLCLFQSLRLSLADQSLGNRLMEIYFAFFTKSVKNGDVNNKTMSVILSGVSRALPYSSLGKAAVKKQLDTFYKLIYLVNSGIAIQILALILQVISRPGKSIKQNSPAPDALHSQQQQLADRFYSSLYRFLLKQDLFESSNRIAALFNLLFRALKSDYSPVRLYAFLKRLLQVACHTNPPVTSAVMFLVSEVLKNKTEASQLFHVESTKLSKAANGSPGKKRNERTEKLLPLPSKIKLKKPLSSASAVVMSKESSVSYDIHARNPLFANANQTSAWEMTLFTRHYHPSVCSFAATVNDHKSIDYNGDPLYDFSLKRFLDRFVRKKSKSGAVGEKQDFDDNASIDSDGFEEVLAKSEKNLQGEEDDPEWENLSEEDWGSVDEDELFDDDDEDEDMFDTEEYFNEMSEFQSHEDEANAVEGIDCLFVPAEEVGEEMIEGNLVSRESTDARRKRRNATSYKVRSRKKLRIA